MCFDGISCMCFICVQRRHDDSDDGLSEPEQGEPSTSRVSDLEDQLASAEEKNRRFQEELSVLLEQKCALQRQVSELQEEISYLRSAEGTVKLLEEVCRKENEEIWASTEQLVSSTQRRSLDSLLNLGEATGSITVSGRNEFATRVVKLLSLTEQRKKGACAK